MRIDANPQANSNKFTMEMTSSATYRSYTQHWPLHRNLFVGSLQLLLWMFFMPSAWVSYVARIDPDLRPDFTLTDLRPEHWRNPLFQRIILSFCVYMPLTLLLSVTILLAFRQSGTILLVGMVEPLIVMLFCFFLGSTFISLPVGLFLSFPGCLACALRYGLTGELSYPLDAGTTTALVYGALIGLTGGVGGWIASNVFSSRSDYSRSRWGTWASGTGMGILLGAVAVFSLHSLLRAMVLLYFPEHITSLAGTWAGLPLALVLLLFLVPIFIAAVGWQRAEVILGINAGVVLLIFGLFALLGALDFFDGTPMGFTIAIIALMGLPYTVVTRIAGPKIGAGASALGLGIGWIAWMVFEAGVFPPAVFLPTLLCIVVSATFAWWAPLVLHPVFEVWNLLVMRCDERRSANVPSLLRWHAAFWNESHPLPFHTLDEYLLMIATRNLAEGQSAIEYLAGSSHQREAPQAVQLELYRCSLENVADVDAIARAAQNVAIGDLDRPVGGLLRKLRRIGEAVGAALNSTAVYHKRLALRGAEESLETLLREMTFSRDRETERFRPTIVRWREIIAAYVQELSAIALQNQRIDNPYIVGVPLADDQELFVGRADVAARIEQIIIDRRRPPLLIYGQRRMGKTSLLHNLGRLLPNHTVLFFVDGEGVSGASDYADFLYAVASAMLRSADQHRRLALPPPERAALMAHPFTAFNEWLDRVEAVLDTVESVGLLALDEFESLDSVLDKQRFDANDLMRMLRSLIQHRRRFKVLLAGSHTIDEFRHWASQLINLQVIKISYLEPRDALDLIENPVKDFALRYEAAASTQVLALTRGHPYLVQLLCSEIVHLKNEHPPERRLHVTVDDVEAAVPHALLAGDMFFADLANQVGPGGVAVLRCIAAAGEGRGAARALMEQQVDEGFDDILALLLRRDVIEPVEEGYRFQVELIRRWFCGSPHR